jgi:hypothetical protein
MESNLVLVSNFLKNPEGICPALLKSVLLTICRLYVL